jgi:hypothetical protein
MLTGRGKNENSACFSPENKGDPGGAFFLGGDFMKLKFGLRGLTRVFVVNAKTDFFIDNGAYILLISEDPKKRQYVCRSFVNNWIFSKARLQKLLKDGFIERVEKSKFKKRANLVYYHFTEKINKFQGEFR